MSLKFIFVLNDISMIGLAKMGIRDQDESTVRQVIVRRTRRLKCYQWMKNQRVVTCHSVLSLASSSSRICSLTHLLMHTSTYWMAMIYKKHYFRYRKLGVDTKSYHTDFSSKGLLVAAARSVLLVQHFRICFSSRKPPHPRSFTFLACPYQRTDWCSSTKVIHVNQTQDNSEGTV